MSLADKTYTLSIRDSSEEIRPSVDTVAKAKAKAVEDINAEPVATDAAGDEKSKPTASPSDVESGSANNEDATESPSTADPEPIPIKPFDEDPGAKEFYHPASVEPQRTVWLPKDVLGLAEEEEKALREAGILVSLDGAKMDSKGHVDISGAPPGGDVRT